MTRKRLFASFIVVALHSAASSAAEFATSPDYFYGVWSLGGKAGCGSSDAEYVLFRSNGTLEVGQGGQVNRVGFWAITNDTIVANTLTAPLKTEESHPFFGESYRYEYVAPTVVSAEQGTFAISIGSDLEKEKRTVTLTRCP
jgi:hypothetical protein